MSVVTHLAVTPRQYDDRIRSLIPLYDELIAEAARALDHAARPIRKVADLGIGTGALARACLQHASGATCGASTADPKIWRWHARACWLFATCHDDDRNFSEPTTSGLRCHGREYSLHHIRPPGELSFYRRCYRALRRGWRPDQWRLCAPASTPRGFARDLDLWFTHLGRTFGNRARGRRVYESWADEDVYVPLAEEIRLLKRAGFDVDIPWRRSPFAVIVGLRRA